MATEEVTHSTHSTHSPKRQSRGAKFIKDLGIYAIGNIGAKAITFFMVPLYTHFVDTPGDYGYYDLSLTIIFAAIPFVTLQLRDGSFRFLFESDDGKRSQVVSMVYRTLAVMMVISGLVTFMVSCMCEVAYVWYVFGLLVAMSLQEVVGQVFRGLGDNKAFVMVGILSALGTALFSVILLVLLGMGLKGIFIANIASRLLAIALVELRMRTLTRFFSVKISVGAVAREVLSYSLPLLPASVFWWLMGSSDRWFVQHYLGLDVTGVYAAAVRLASITYFVSNIYYQAWQETAISQYRSPDRDKFFTTMFNGYLYLLSLLVIVISFGLKLNYGWIVDPQFRHSVWYLFPAVLTPAIFAVSAFFDLGYQCAKDTKRSLPSVVVAAMVNVACNLLFTPRIGVWGVLGTSVFSYLVLIVIRWHDMKRYMRLTIHRRSLIPIAIMLASALPFYLDTALWQDAIVLATLIALFAKLCPPDVRANVGHIVAKFKGKLRHHEAAQ